MISHMVNIDKKRKMKVEKMDIIMNSRNDMVQLFLDFIRPLKAFYSPKRAFLHVGNTGAHYGEKSARMEGWARVLWGLGPLWSADNSGLPAEQQEEIREWLVLYRTGIIHGTDPGDSEYWADIFDYDQKMVEVAALVFSITVNRGELWDTLTDGQKDNLYRWLRQMNDYDMPKNNWRYFRILTNMTFRLLGLEWREDRMEEDFALIEGSYTGDGWYYDGNPGQVDYYVAFAIHYYGLIYAQHMEALEPERCRILKERSTKFFDDFVYWFANNGEEIPFGRSLTYRFAHSGLFGAMAYARLDVDYGVLKNLVLRNIEVWMQRPIFDNTGILSIGYGYPNLLMSESYNGCGSPYWCNKAFIVLGLNEDHPFWTAEPKVYPYEPVKYLKHPHMIVTHDDNDHVLAYVTGQHLGLDHGRGAEKYEKFVYSNQFGFSVSRGTSLEQGAFDNTLAFSVKGENRYCMRYGQTDFSSDEEKLSAKYSPLTGVEVISTVVPCSPWHVRIHQITNCVPVTAADGGFSIARERCFEVTEGAGTGRLESENIEITEASAFVRAPWGVSGIVTETEGTTKLVTPFPNTNLFYNLTVIPTVTAELEPGSHLLITSVFADRSASAGEMAGQKPFVSVEEGSVTIAYRGRTVTVPLL